MKSKHYSYRYYSNKAVVNDYDCDRYGSLFGEFLRGQEVNIYFEFLSSNGTVLDVGTGTGKLVIPLIQRRKNLAIGIDPSLNMLSYLKGKGMDNSLEVKVSVADVHELPFADKSFDSIVMSRVMMHLVDWRKAIKELCRVSNKEIILDFPPLFGFTSIVPSIRLFTKIFYRPPYSYNVFSMKSIRNELEKQNFKIIESKRLFFLPIFIHRYINNVRVSILIENFFSKIGLVKLFGSPVIIKVQRHCEYYMLPKKSTII